MARHLGGVIYGRVVKLRSQGGVVLAPPPRPATADINGFADHHPRARCLGIRAMLPKLLGRLAYLDWLKALSSGAKPTIGTCSKSAIVALV